MFWRVTQVSSKQCRQKNKMGGRVKADNIVVCVECDIFIHLHVQQVAWKTLLIWRKKSLLKLVTFFGSLPRVLFKYSALRWCFRSVIFTGEKNEMMLIKLLGTLCFILICLCTRWWWWQRQMNGITKTNKLFKCISSAVFHALYK